MREARFQLAQRRRPPAENIWSAFGGAYSYYFMMSDGILRRFQNLWHHKIYKLS